MGALRKPTGGGIAAEYGLIENNPANGRFVPAGRNLTDMQLAFIDRFMVNGSNAADAAKVAGYSFPDREGYKLRRNPAVVAEIRQRACEALLDDAPVARQVMNEIMRDPTAPAAVRVTCCKWVLEAAGVGLEAQKLQAKVVDSGSKSMSEMTTDELEAHVAMLAAAVEAKKVIESTIEVG